MLNGHERKTLREIQREVAAEDPEFAETFRAAAKPEPSIFDRPGLVIVIAFLVIVEFFLLSIGLPGLAVLLAIVAGTSAAVWRYRHAIVRWME